jgi:XTP/dITP diphosphohydrolase
MEKKNRGPARRHGGKLKELNRILTPLELSLKSQSEYDVPEVPEDGLSFVENAIIKARAASRHTGLPAIADDSGLEVDYLEGAPGIHSARYSGKGDDANNAKLLQAMENVPEEQRSARFQCVLVYMRHGEDPTPLVCQGSWEGRILFSQQGENGFGYDPLFFVPQHNCSSAQLGPELKNQISHRAIASARLLEALGKRRS